MVVYGRINKEISELNDLPNLNKNAVDSINSALGTATNDNQLPYNFSIQFGNDNLVSESGGNDRDVLISPNGGKSWKKYSMQEAVKWRNSVYYDL